MSEIKILLIFLLNCTWGIIQSFIGLIMFFIFIKKPHYIYKGSIITLFSKSFGSISLGIFIFMGNNVEKERAVQDNLINHEYGHSMQSLLLGPFYLFIIGLPSIIWAVFLSKRKTNKNYYSFFSESWADKWGNVKRK